MRNVQPSNSRWVTLAWLLPFVLLALPNCFLDSTGASCAENPNHPNCQSEVEDCEQAGSNCPDTTTCEEDPLDPECVLVDPIPVFQPGEDPSDAIFCDIPKPRAPGDDGCASQEDAENAANISLSEAAIALVNGETATFALDFSEAATTACGGLPRIIKYFGPYPQGMRVCINCSTQIDAVYVNPTEACRAKCIDEVNADGFIPAEGANDYCEANAKVSTNFDPAECQDDACTLSGSPNMNWVDPRETPEPVQWIDHIGTSDSSGTNSLERIAPTTTPTADFDAGAASAQVITTGDAWVEFSALDGTDKAHVLGVRESRDASDNPCTDTSTCADGDPSLNGIGFAISLNTDGQVYVLEIIAGVLEIQGPFGTYTSGERYRVHVTDRHDGTTTITYSRIVLGVDTQFAETTLDHPRYPLRVDAIFREQGAILSNVNIVRIK